MHPAEKAAYDACMKGKVLPDKTKEKVQHLLELNKCYNVVGKEGWHCAGNRRKCETDLCCGQLTDAASKTLRYSCEKKTATKVVVGDTTNVEYNFKCSEVKGATNLVMGLSSLVIASAMLM